MSPEAVGMFKQAVNVREFCASVDLRFQEGITDFKKESQIV